MRRFKVITYILLLSSMSIAPGLSAEVSVGTGGGGSCSLTIKKITQHWNDAKQTMLPNKAKLTRAKREHFYCVSPQALRDAMEKRVSSGSQLRCFSDTSGSGLGLCCDESLSECARLRPDVVPESAQPKKKEPAYLKSKSDWVKPPSDKDQW
jgi:hypothetical protein